VCVHRRTDAGVWPAESEMCVGGMVFSLPALNTSVAVDAIYDNILDADGRSLLR
jgi:hypothetical protein